MSNDGTIQILLAVYQCERFLSAQIQSYFDQTYKNWKVLARDDQSSDSSPRILEELAKHHPEKIELSTGVDGNLGSVGNFGHLLDAADSDYVMFSDCDDLWHPDKLEVSMRKMKSMEEQFGMDSPLLVHTNLTVKDQDLEVVHRSFWEYQNLDPSFSMSLNRELVFNVVTGSTILMNRSLVNLARPIPAHVPVHDWWVALVALAIGHVGYIEKPTVDYRQHGSNELGASGMNLGYIVSRFASIFSKEGSVPQLIRASRLQAEELRNRFGASLAPSNQEVVNAWIATQEQSGIRSVRRCLRHKLLPGGLARNAGMLLALLVDS